MQSAYVWKLVSLSLLKTLWLSELTIPRKSLFHVTILFPLKATKKKLLRTRQKETLVREQCIEQGKTHKVDTLNTDKSVCNKIINGYLNNNIPLFELLQTFSLY